MIKLLIAVMLLIAVALVGGAYLQFNPGFLILAILGFGIFMVGRIGEPTLPPGAMAPPIGVRAMGFTLAATTSG
jgi:hypothetical protein